VLVFRVLAGVASDAAWLIIQREMRYTRIKRLDKFKYLVRTVSNISFESLRCDLT
jgi:hypothetical protein